MSFWSKYFLPPGSRVPNSLSLGGEHGETLALLLLLVDRRQIATLKLSLVGEENVVCLVYFRLPAEQKKIEFIPDKCKVAQMHVPPKKCLAVQAPT